MVKMKNKLIEAIDLSTLPTENIYKSLLSLSKVSNVLMNGMFPGAALEHLAAAQEFSKTLHEGLMEEFQGRADARDFEPNLPEQPQAVTPEVVNE